VCGEKQLVAAFAQYGRTSRVPLLWVSADNDHFFGPRLTSQLTGAFANAGGHVTYVKTAAFGDDGHTLFNAAGIPIWSPIVDRSWRRTISCCATDRSMFPPQRAAAIEPEQPGP
jgi:hypothetical protein